jgi:hypothetical protein
MGRKEAVAARRRIYIRNYETNGIYGHQGRSTNTNFQNSPTQNNGVTE